MGGGHYEVVGMWPLESRDAQHVHSEHPVK